jgi:hypothetical protein
MQRFTGVAACAWLLFASLPAHADMVKGQLKTGVSGHNDDAAPVSNDHTAALEVVEDRVTERTGRFTEGKTQRQLFTVKASSAPGAGFASGSFGYRTAGSAFSESDTGDIKTRTEKGTYVSFDIGFDRYANTQATATGSVGRAIHDEHRTAKGTRQLMGEESCGVEIGGAVIGDHSTPVVKAGCQKEMQICGALNDSESQVLCFVVDAKAAFGTQLEGRGTLGASYRVRISGERDKDSAPSYFYVTPTGSFLGMRDLVHGSGAESFSAGAVLGVGAF